MSSLWGQRPTFPAIADEHYEHNDAGTRTLT